MAAGKEEFSAYLKVGARRKAPTERRYTGRNLLTSYYYRALASLASN